MKSKIITQTQKNVKKLLNLKQQKKNLTRLKKSRYMREEYPKRKKRLNLTFDHPDFKKVQNHADEIGVTPTAFIRDSTLAYIDQERIPTQEVEQTFREFIFLLRNISSNLNQISRQANTLQKLSLKDFIQTKRLINDLENTAEDFTKRF